MGYMMLRKTKLTFDWPVALTAMLAVVVFATVQIGCSEKSTMSERRYAKTNQRQTVDSAMVPPLESAEGVLHEMGLAQEISEFNTEAYDEIVENEFLDSLNNPKSTFSIDVDTASYSNVRRMIRSGQKPPVGAVRIEEMVNYFEYDYPQPTGEHPFSVTTDLAQCPWNSDHQLVRVGLKGKTIESEERPSANLVFLLDVSGSMNSPNKLPLVKQAMKMLVRNLENRDRIAIVVYAGASGVVLPSTSCDDSRVIVNALDRLSAGGSTNGGQGIELAYRIAARNFQEGGINRVILCTDGDFNVGTTNQSQLIDLIQRKAKSGVFLSVLGFGTGNYKDSTMEKLADKGNGNYAYIDGLLEARKSLVQQMSGTLLTIAKDVKIQIDFNAARVAAYRLIGYENRMLANKDFADDTKDAGEIGAGHTVTAIYEVVPAGAESPAIKDSGSQFVETRVKADAKESDTLLTVSLRYKQPDGDTSQEFKVALDHSADTNLEPPAGDFRFAASVAAFGMMLRDSQFKGTADWRWIIEAAKENTGDDENGFRSEFVQLAREAEMICAR